MLMHRVQHGNGSSWRRELRIPIPERLVTEEMLPLQPSDKPSPELTQPSLNFSNLEKISRIDNSGMLHKELHRPTSEIYSLKTIHHGDTDLAYHRNKIQEIRQYVRIFGSLESPNLLKCYNILVNDDKDAGNIYLLFEHFDGVSLKDAHIPHEPSLVNIARQIINGLAYLHSRKLVHRFLRPSRFLISSKEEVKIAAPLSTASPMSMWIDTAYCSPERITTDFFPAYNGYAGDIWSMGLSILELYLGAYPLEVSQEGDWASLQRAICNEDPPTPPLAASPEFRGFIQCCLKKDPAERWTAKQLLHHPFILGNQLSK